MPGPAAAKGKLSKEEIIEILERNFDIYQKEPNFIKYLVELAFYLVHHQYDPNRRPPPKKIDPSQDSIPPPIVAEARDRLMNLQTSFTVERDKGLCPFCGSKAVRGRRCPTCGLMIN